MTAQEWEKFFVFLDNLVRHAGRNWEEAKDEVETRARAVDADIALEEFVGWWDGDSENPGR